MVVQGLRFCTPNAGDPGLVPGQGTRSHELQLGRSKDKKKKKKKLRQFIVTVKGLR